MAQYMQDAVRAQGAGQNQAFPMFGRIIDRMNQARSGAFLRPNAKPRQAAPTAIPFGGMLRPNAPQQASTTASVASPGQTQVIRPSAQAARRQGPGADSDTSLLTRQMGPEDVALGMSSLLGG